MRSACTAQHALCPGRCGTCAAHPVLRGPHMARHVPRAAPRAPITAHQQQHDHAPSHSAWKKPTYFLRELVPRLIRLGTNSYYCLSWFFHTGWAARTPRGAARAASRVRRMPRAVHGACAVLCTLHTCAVCCAPHAARRASLAPCHAPCATRWALCAAHRAQCVPHGKSLAAHSAARCTQHGTHSLLMLLRASR